jgi:hypothetical protein
VRRLLRARVNTGALPFVLDPAVPTPLEKRGVAVLVVSGAVLVAETPRQRATSTIRSTASLVRPNDGELQAAARAPRRNT